MLKKTIALAVAAGLALTACGDADDDSSSPADPTTVTEAPERIVSLLASGTEILFAIGAGDQVVAADSYSNFPEEAPTTDLSAYDPNVEAISGYDPDLVVVDGSNPDLVSALEGLDIPVYVSQAPRDLEELYAEIESFGEVTGQEAGAAEVVAEMRADIEAILARVPETEVPLRFYHELDDLLYSITSDTFIGQLYALAGLENVADAADPDGRSGGYPQLSAEHLVEADPDLVFLADVKCCGQTAETFGARPGFSALSAVRDGNVVLLDDDIASRWGPRVVDLLDTIVSAVEAAVAGQPAAA